MNYLFFYEERYPTFHLLPSFKQSHMRARGCLQLNKSRNNNAIVPTLAHYAAEKYRHEFDDEHNVIL